jgi:general stress protein 26
MSDDIRKQLWKALDNSPFMMMRLEGSNDHAIPMTAQLDPDNDGYFYVFHNQDGRLAQGGKAMAQYSAKGHDLFACIAGSLTDATDPALVDKYWSRTMEAWYEGGKDDPNLSLLRFDLADAEIWTADASIKGLFKMITGQTVKDGELGDHATVQL